jgi:hypothetical protein
VLRSQYLSRGDRRVVCGRVRAVKSRKCEPTLLAAATEIHESERPFTWSAGLKHVSVHHSTEKWLDSQ